MKTGILIVTDSLDIGGIETYIHGVCKKIDKNKYRVTVYALMKGRDALARDIESFGCQVVFADGDSKAQRLRDLRLILKHNPISIVHFHVRHSYLMLAAKLYGKKVILHSHFASWQGSKNPLKSLIMKFFLGGVCDLMLACSQDAGKNAFYGHDFIIARNGIDVKKFKFNQSKRAALRKQHHLQDKKIILQVGRINWNKNQLFSVKILGELLKYDGRYVLVLIGDDGGRGEIEPTIEALRLVDKVIILGNVNNVQDYYSFADVVLVPSRHEGFSLAAIEAQVSGTVCCVSDAIPEEALITRSAIRLGLDQPASVWAQRIHGALNQSEESSESESSKYDLSSTVPELEQQYERLISHE